MAQGDTAAKRPADPTPLAPRREAVVAGTTVTVEWEPVEGVAEYCVQIARDTAFEHVVFEEDVEHMTSLAIEPDFPADDARYYWRVMARNSAGWSEGEKIESFISGMPEEVAAGIHDADDDEDLGPMSELVKATNIEMAADVTGSEKLFQKEREMGVAHEGVEAKQILVMVVATVLLITVLVIALITATNVVHRDMIYTVANNSTYPELREIERQSAQKLESYAIVDDAEGVYRVPIHRAMELMAEDARGRETPETQISEEWTRVMQAQR